MGLTVSEVAGLQDDIEKLYEELSDALQRDDSGKRRIDRGERRKILRLTLALASKLVLEALD